MPSKVQPNAYLIYKIISIKYPCLRRFKAVRNNYLVLVQMSLRYLENGVLGAQQIVFNSLEINSSMEKLNLLLNTLEEYFYSKTKTILIHSLICQENIFKNCPNCPKQLTLLSLALENQAKRHLPNFYLISMD